jgi:hypothetical protein
MGFGNKEGLYTLRVIHMSLGLWITYNFAKRLVGMRWGIVNGKGEDRTTK